MFQILKCDGTQKIPMHGHAILKFMQKFLLVIDCKLESGDYIKIIMPQFFLKYSSLGNQVMK